MEFSRPPLVVAFELSEKRKAIVADALAGASDVVCLTELDEAARAEALRNAGVLLTFNTAKELRPGEAKLLAGARLIQFMIAGVDFIPLGELPKGMPVATNGGGYAESMAEHALAMALPDIPVSDRDQARADAFILQPVSCERDITCPFQPFEILTPAPCARRTGRSRTVSLCGKA